MIIYLQYSTMDNLKYNRKDLTTDLAVGGVNGAVFSTIYGFYTASLETPRGTGYGNKWVRLFCKYGSHKAKNTAKVMPLCPLGRIAYSMCKIHGYEDWKAAVACFVVGYLYLAAVKI